MHVHAHARVMLSDTSFSTQVCHAVGIAGDVHLALCCPADPPASGWLNSRKSPYRTYSKQQQHLNNNGSSFQPRGLTCSCLCPSTRPHPCLLPPRPDFSGWSLQLLLAQAMPSLPTHHLQQERLQAAFTAHSRQQRAMCSHRGSCWMQCLDWYIPVWQDCILPCDLPMLGCAKLPAQQRQQRSHHAEGQVCSRHTSVQGIGCLCTPWLLMT
jgi:hypothetical protein